MNKFRFLTSGESHGKCLNAIIEGLPSNLKINTELINSELSRRQQGYGRGDRMKIETDKIEIKSGVRFGLTTGAPICIEISNNDWGNWVIPMSVDEINPGNPEIVELINNKKITKVRPGHADFAGAIKYNQYDIRNVLERSSARETATRVAVGGLAKCLLNEFGIEISSQVKQIGNAECSEDICSEIDKAKEMGVTLGGKFAINIKNLPVGLGSFVHWDKRLDGILAQALMSIPAIKAVEIGAGVASATLNGAQMHDEIFCENDRIFRKTNNAGGIEGGMTNGEDIVITSTMKPIPTMKHPLQSIDIETKEPVQAHFERSDTCAVEACAIVGEAMCAIVIADELLNKFGGDSIEEMKKNYGQ